MRSIFCFLMVFGIILPSYSQTSDVMKYYIAYDVSGSVGSIDVNDNLENSLFRLLNIDRNDVTKKEVAYEEAISFNLYTFGSDLTSQLYDAFDREKPVRLQQLANKTRRSRSQMESNLTTALEKILSELKSHKTLRSTGVFIFTDGSFSVDDIRAPAKGKDTAFVNAKLKTDSLLSEIKKIVGSNKVFIIQTSQANPIFEFSTQRQLLPKLRLDSVAVSPNYFWVDSRDSITKPKHLERLDRFIQQANASISTHPFLPLEDEVQVMLTIQEIASAKNILKALGKDTTTESGTQESYILTTILELVKKPLLTAAEIDTINKNVDFFVKSSNKTSSNNEKVENADKLWLNEIKQEKQDQVFDSLKGSANKGKGNKEKLTGTNRPIALTEAYNPAAATAVSELATQAKGWENLEQNLILGMADYMVKRSKMEVTYAFIENMDDYVFSQYLEMAQIFPETYRFVKNDHADYDLLSLKNVLKKDIATLPSNILKYPNLINNESLYSFWMYMQLYNSLIDHGSLEQSFLSLHTLVNKPAPHEHWLLIERMKKSPAGKAMILSINLIKYLNEYNLAESYTQYDAETDLSALSVMLFANSLNLDSVKTVHNIPAITREVGNVYRNYTFVVSQIESLKVLLDNPPTSDFDGYRKYQKDMLMDILKRISSILTSGAEVTRYIELETKDIGKKIKENVVDSPKVEPNGKKKGEIPVSKKPKDTSEKLEELSKQYNVIVEVLESSYAGNVDTIKKYVGGYLSSAEVDWIKSNTSKEALSQFLYQKLNALWIQKNPDSRKAIGLINQGVDAWFNIKDENYAQAMFNLANGLLANFPENSRIHSLNTFLLASGEIAAARSSDDISNIIARHTLPVASHKLKKEWGTAFMLGSYVGISFAHYPHQNAIEKYRSFPVVNAIIGPEFVYGIKGKQAVSIMTTVLDLGNIVHYQVSGYDDADSAIPQEDLSFARILSPGILVSYAPWEKIPIAVIGSWMANPSRYQVGVALDMPLLGFRKWNRK